MITRTAPTANGVVKTLRRGLTSKGLILIDANEATRIANPTITMIVGNGVSLRMLKISFINFRVSIFSHPSVTN